MELEVGEYMRSDSGIILKYEYLKKYENEVCLGQKGKCWSFEDEEELEDFIEQRIIKHSPSIIDLIEEGDYVNGSYCFGKEQDELVIENGAMIYGEQRIKQKDIEDIVTKEQFNQMKYIVGDD